MEELPTAPQQQPARSRFAKAVVFLLLAVLLLVGGWKGFQYARLHLALARAQREFSNAQYMRAEFWTNSALGVDEKNVGAMRLMAEINEAQDKPVAMVWRVKVVQHAPESTADIMAWAKSAMRFGQDEMAQKALGSLPQDFKGKSAEYYELMAGFALSNRAPALAETYFAKAAELDPANPVYAENVAAFRLSNSPSPEVRAAAARDLEGMLKDPRVNLSATRTLLHDAVHAMDRERAKKFAEKLRSLPGRNFSDDLLCLEASTSEPVLRASLDEVEHRAESNAEWATETGSWLNAHGMAAETLQWTAKLPEAIRSNIRVQMTAAESYTAMRDWKGLEAFLANCHWGGGDYLRLATLVRCKRELSEPWDKEWKQLVAEVQANPPQDYLLAQLVAAWKWRDEALDLLWGAATKPLTDTKALRSLRDIYTQANDTRNLLRVARAQSDLDPTNPARKNNEAFLTLLLYGASDRSQRLAKEAATANPNVPEWVATYAYALHLAGKDTDAKKIIEKLPPEALGRPDIALYYAIVLAANGEEAKAKESLAKLSQEGLLPEEKKLAAALALKLNDAGH